MRDILELSPEIAAMVMPANDSGFAAEASTLGIGVEPWPTIIKFNGKSYTRVREDRREGELYAVIYQGGYAEAFRKLTVYND